MSQVQTITIFEENIGKNLSRGLYSQKLQYDAVIVSISPISNGCFPGFRVAYTVDAINNPVEGSSYLELVAYHYSGGTYAPSGYTVVAFACLEEDPSRTYVFAAKGVG